MSYKVLGPVWIPENTSVKENVNIYNFFEIRVFKIGTYFMSIKLGYTYFKS